MPAAGGIGAFFKLSLANVRTCLPAWLQGEMGDEFVEHLEALAGKLEYVARDDTARFSAAYRRGWWCGGGGVGGVCVGWGGVGGGDGRQAGRQQTQQGGGTAGRQAGSTAAHNACTPPTHWKVLPLAAGTWRLSWSG